MSLAPHQFDPVSRSFVAFVAAHRPDWLRHARLEERSRPGEGFCEIAFPPSPGHPAADPLLVSTDGEEVTISFGPHHVHVEAPDLDEDRDGWREAIGRVDAILAEEVAAVSIWSGPRLRLSFLDEAANLPLYREEPEGDHVLRIQSWRGTHDRAVPVQWRGVSRAMRQREPG